MINGIDVSKHNGTIDWSKVKAAGYDFAMIRLGWAGYAGPIVANGGLDPMFEANIKGAQAAGVDVGVYVYSYCKTAAAAKIAAQETVELVMDSQLTYPIAFDFEESMYASMTKEENTAMCEAFLSTAEKAGYYAMLYTFKSYAEYNLNMTDLAKYDFWLAHVGNNGATKISTSYSGPYGMWQYSWKGGIKGISGDVDLNYAYMDYPSIIKAAGLNGFTGEDKKDIEQDLEKSASNCEQCKDKDFYHDTLSKIKQLADNALQ